ncbi:unnamed protein product [Rhizoctonia solani]|uniref:Uncharacterized protein n=1 Tax=Rhizoctonia solani TaxID=456999 RepID=A0A8H3CRU0_9AGAM|nr:unnamed protein product [Rhizoctonia solani]
MEYRAGPGLSKEWKTNEAQWERERAGWETEHAHWEDKQAKMDNLQENIDALTHERDAYIAKLDEVQTELQKSKKSRGNELEKTEAEMKRMEEDMATLADRARHAEEICKARFRPTKTRIKTSSSSETEKQLRNLEIRCVRAENDRVEVVRDRAEIEDEMERIRVELEDVRHERGLLEQERDVLAEELASEKAAHTVLASEHKRVAARLDDLDGEHQSSLDTIRRLERIVQARNTELAQTEESI